MERPAVLREVSGVTLISYGKAVHACTAAAEALEALGISAEVLDLRTLKPLDEEGIVASVRKTDGAVAVQNSKNLQDQPLSSRLMAVHNRLGRPSSR